LSYTIGFGTIKDDEQAKFILHKYSLGFVDLQSQIQLIIEGIQESSSESGLFPMLQRQGTFQPIDLPQKYREKKLLEKAEISYKQEIQSIQLVFGQSHILCLILKFNLALIYGSQGRWKEAEQLEVQVEETSLRVLGEEHPSTLNSIANLAATYRNQGR